MTAEKSVEMTEYKLVAKMAFVKVEFLGIQMAAN